ncbi:hypothetical protein I553_9809 [Mycobacterium xenopi 4042]|uniref:Uncharacterized protein n=1 Tax=Mycobacterium xenopi 4042 TaxID=1299334 RepID=X7YNH1_MYCXE|nr:hypothetical protein I553_9809 [Mycobacterium xenopi 4042]
MPTRNEAVLLTVDPDRHAIEVVYIDEVYGAGVRRRGGLRLPDVPRRPAGATLPQRGRL